MRIYRVEDETGYGMFRSDRTPVDCWSDGFDAPYHPSPAEDRMDLPVNDTRYDWYFGCTTIAMLKHWATHKNVHKKLHEAGFFIAVYEIDGYPDEVLKSRSGTQVAFVKKKATFIRRYPLWQQSHVRTSMKSSMEESSISKPEMGSGILCVEMDEQNIGSILNVLGFPSKSASEITEQLMKGTSGRAVF